MVGCLFWMHISHKRNVISPVSGFAHLSCRYACQNQNIVHFENKENLTIVSLNEVSDTIKFASSMNFTL